MNRLSLYSDQINLEKTIELFGPLNSRSKVIIICLTCKQEKIICTGHLYRLERESKKYVCRKCLANTEESKQQRSKQSKLAWQNEQYAVNLSNKLKLIANTKEGKQQRSKQAKSAWRNEEFAKQQRSRLTTIAKSEAHRKLVSDRNKADYLNDPIKYQETKVSALHTETARKNHRQALQKSEYKKIHSDLAKQRFQNPEYKEKQMKSRLNPEYLEKQAKSRAEFLKSGKDSVIERISQQLLEVLNIKYEKHYHLGPYEFDLFIPSHDLLIECQGEYWHAFDQTKKKDASKFTYVDIYFPKFKILYLYERDFLNPGLIKQKLVKQLFQTGYEDQQIDFSFFDLNIEELSTKIKLENSFYSAPEEFLQSFHYAGFGRNSNIIYGAYLKDKLIAVCKFAGVVRKEVATSLQHTSSEVLELDRFCIHPQYQKKNFASWFISRCSKLVFFKFSNIICLVSFADSTYGHFGIIYKAAGWKEVGKTKPDYHYINDKGWVIHKKTLYNHAIKMKKTESEYVSDNGYYKIYGKEKIKFVLENPNSGSNNGIWFL